MNRISGIYKITSPSGKIYIGQSVDISRRFRQYQDMNRNKKHPKLHNSFLKYGVNNHIFEVIEKCEDIFLNERERYWQDFYNVLSSKGLNLTLTRTLSKRYIHSEDTINKISVKARTRKRSPHSSEVKKTMSFVKIGDKNPFFGKNHSVKTRMKMSKTRRKTKLRTSNKPVIDTSDNKIYLSIINAWELNFKNKMSLSSFKAMLSGQNPNKTSFKLNS